jgi:hypothetical protein
MVTVLGGGAKNGLLKWAELCDFFFFPIEFYSISKVYSLFLQHMMFCQILINEGTMISLEAVIKGTTITHLILMPSLEEIEKMDFSILILMTCLRRMTYLVIVLVIHQKVSQGQSTNT